MFRLEKNNINRLKVLRFLKRKPIIKDEEKQELINNLQNFHEEQANVKIVYFINGVTESEYSKIKKVNVKKGIVILRSRVKIPIDLIIEVKKQ